MLYVFAVLTENYVFFSDDATDYEFKLFAVNAEGFGEPVIVQYTTPKRSNGSNSSDTFETNLVFQ